jgi:hypothetical protein
MSSAPRQTRQNAMRDLAISSIWVVVCVLFLNVDRHRIVELQAAGRHVSPVRWIQIPLWVATLVFWIRNGWKAWSRIRANDSESR